jgi:hypothetical protein
MYKKKEIKITQFEQRPEYLKSWYSLYKNTRYVKDSIIPFSIVDDSIPYKKADTDMIAVSTYEINEELLKEFVIKELLVNRLSLEEKDIIKSALWEYGTDYEKIDNILDKLYYENQEYSNRLGKLDTSEV